jgi:mgtE-like transporter
LFFFDVLGKWFIGMACLVMVLLVCYILSRNLHEVEFTKTLKESMVTMVFVAFMVNVTGTLLHGISNSVGDRIEIYTVYPGLIGMIGNVGSVVGSTATTKLALGLLTPSFSSMRKHLKNIFSAWAASLIMFVILTALSLLSHGLFSLSSIYSLISILLVTNVISVAAITFLSFGVSILTFKRGLDPDNFVIAVESAFADSITSLALLLTLLLMG